jgi:SAM-dependent methyltransferase
MKDEVTRREASTVGDTGGDVDRILLEQARYYEDRAPEYEDVWYRRGAYDLGPEGNRHWYEEAAWLEAVVEGLGETGVVLELACGTGIFTRFLAPIASRLIAVDAAAPALAINRERFADAGVEHVHADLFRWEPPDGVRFDLIFFSFLLSHIPPVRFQEFWDRLARWLAPDGRVFFCDDAPGVESRRSNPGRDALDGPAFAHRRRLNDGREYTIVKVLHDPNELTVSLAELGWEADVRQSGEEFYYGIATRAPSGV